MSAVHRRQKMMRKKRSLHGSLGRWFWTRLRAGNDGREHAADVCAVGNLTEEDAEEVQAARRMRDDLQVVVLRLA
jgi:hypothetical protein